MTVERHNAVAEYAEANDLLFYDFNEKALYEQNGFDYPTDMHNNSTTGDKNAHTNPSGAKKITHFIKRYIDKQLRNHTETKLAVGRDEGI